MLVHSINTWLGTSHLPVFNTHRCWKIISTPDKGRWGAWWLSGLSHHLQHWHTVLKCQFKSYCSVSDPISSGTPGKATAIWPCTMHLAICYVDGHCHPHRRLGENSWFFTLAWAKPCCFGHLVKEPRDGKYLSIDFSFQDNNFGFGVNK